MENLYFSSLGCLLLWLNLAGSLIFPYFSCILVSEFPEFLWEFHVLLPTYYRGVTNMQRGLSVSLFAVSGPNHLTSH